MLELGNAIIWNVWNVLKIWTLLVGKYMLDRCGFKLILKKKMWNSKTLGFDKRKVTLRRFKHFGQEIDSIVVHSYPTKATLLRYLQWRAGFLWERWNTRRLFSTIYLALIHSCLSPAFSLRSREVFSDLKSGVPSLARTLIIYLHTDS